MEPPSNSPEYLLLFRGTDWESQVHPDDAPQLMEKIYGWMDRLAAEGKVVGARPLGLDGKTVQGRQGNLIADGPFAEAKEVVGGYLIVRAASLDEATSIARGFPLLNYGAMVEVRPLADQCPIFERIQLRRAHMAMAG